MSNSSRLQLFPFAWMLRNISSPVVYNPGPVKTFYAIRNVPGWMREELHTLQLISVSKFFCWLGLNFSGKKMCVCVCTCLSVWLSVCLWVFLLVCMFVLLCVLFYFKLAHCFIADFLFLFFWFFTKNSFSYAPTGIKLVMYCYHWYHWFLIVLPSSPMY